MWEAANTVVSGIITGSIYALLAVGFSLVFSVSGVLNLAQGAFVTLGALVFYTLGAALHWPLVLALLATLLVVSAVAALVEWIVIRPALGHISNTNLLILMAGFLTFFEGLAFLVWGSGTYSITPFSGQKPLHVGGLYVPTQGLWVVGSALVLVVALWWMLSRTATGKALRACAGNAAAARLMGIPVDRLIMLAFAASGALGAIAGAMFVPLTSLDFSGMANYTNQGLIAVTLGGLGNFFGSIVGGLGLGLAEQTISGYVSSLFSTALAILVLMAFLIWRPRGLLGGGQGERVDVRETQRGTFYFAPRISRRVFAPMAVVVAAVMLGLPYLIGSTGLLHLVVITGIFCLALLGLDVLTGVAGQVSLGQAGFMAIGGYTSAILSAQYHISPLLGLLAGVVLSSLVGLLLSFSAARVRGLYLAVMTLAFGIFVQVIADGLTVTGGPSGMAVSTPFSIPGFQFTGDTSMYYLVWGLVAVALLLFQNLLRRDRGRLWRVMRLDQTGAQALGLNLVVAKIEVFLLGAVCASVAGSLYGYYFHYLGPSMVGSEMSLSMVTMLVIGGAGTLIGPMIGAALIELLPQISQSVQNWEPLMQGIVLIVFLRYLPGGLYGGFLNLVARWGRRRPDVPRLSEQAQKGGQS